MKASGQYYDNEQQVPNVLPVLSDSPDSLIIVPIAS